MTHLKPGDTAPVFTAKDQDDNSRSSEEFKGEWLFLYFYPKDNTPGCTKEACGIRDNYTQISEFAHVVGVSIDSVKSHDNFARKHGLPFTLLSDEDKSIVKAYGVWGPKKSFGKEYDGTHRESFLIDPLGVIKKVYKNVKPQTHAYQVVEDLQELV